MIPRDAVLLRRYVLNRSAGHFPHAEYARRTVRDGVAVWIKCDRVAARAEGRWKRLRIEGRPWCPVLGRRAEIANDVELQSFFTTVPDDGWHRLERDVRLRPTRCLDEWRAAGARLVELVRASAAGTPTPGKLSGWPKQRGRGPRTLIGGGTRRR